MKVIWPTIVSGAVLLAGLSALRAQVAAPPPLPRVDDVLKRVMDRAKAEDEHEHEFKTHYHFIRTKVTEFRNAKGELKKREAKRSENRPVVATTAGPPPPGVAEPKTHDDAGTNGPVTDTRSNVRGKAFERNDFLLNGDLLKRFDFSVTGREILNGRPTLIVDFLPAKKPWPVRNLKDRFINKAAGRVWVDEGEYALVKADLRLTERVNVVGGLVGAVWKFTCGFLRERTPEGFWFTRGADWHLEGREVFIRRTVDYHEERTGVRKAV
ncbi:MAG: hypothetical protein MUF81_00630 [Verrucomicrobia bacterium]|jgi:hypothetical protein|nr:hypothetical protein [Verrucomicrobiota bacterium]